MAEQSISGPTNKALGIIQFVLDQLIEGVGDQAVIAAAETQWPWLLTPVIKQIFEWAVGKLSAYIDSNLFKMAVKITIRIQSTARRDEYNAAIKPIIDGSATDVDIQKARDAADAVIERNR